MPPSAPPRVFISDSSHLEELFGADVAVMHLGHVEPAVEQLLRLARPSVLRLSAAVQSHMVADASVTSALAALGGSVGGDDTASTAAALDATRRGLQLQRALGDAWPYCAAFVYNKCRSQQPAPREAVRRLRVWLVTPRAVALFRGLQVRQGCK